MFAGASIINATAFHACPFDLCLPLPVSCEFIGTCCYMQLHHAASEDTPQAVSYTDLIIDYRVWFPINFIFHMHMQLHGMLELLSSHMVPHK